MNNRCPKFLKLLRTSVQWLLFDPKAGPPYTGKLIIEIDVVQGRPMAAAIVHRSKAVRFENADDERGDTSLSDLSDPSSP